MHCNDSCQGTILYRPTLIPIITPQLKYLEYLVEIYVTDIEYIKLQNNIIHQHSNAHKGAKYMNFDMNRWLSRNHNHKSNVVIIIIIRQT
jgi:hypothetical protein